MIPYSYFGDGKENLKAETESLNDLTVHNPHFLNFYREFEEKIYAAIFKSVNREAVGFIPLSASAPGHSSIRSRVANSAPFLSFTL